MTTTRLEERVRDALRTEADGLPLTIDAGSILARLERRRRMRRLERRVMAAAAAIALAIGAGTLIMLNGQARVPVGATPTPSRSETPPPSSLVEAHPSLANLTPPAGQIVLDTTHEPTANGSSARMFVGSLPPGSGYAVVWTCSGPGSLGFEIGEGSPPLIVGSPQDCDGSIDTDASTTASTGAVPFYLTVDSRAAWHVIVGVQPAATNGEPTPEPTPAATGTASLDTSNAALLTYVTGTSDGTGANVVVDALTADGNRGRVAVVPFGFPNPAWPTASQIDARSIRVNPAGLLALELLGPEGNPAGGLVLDLRDLGKPAVVLRDADGGGMTWGPGGLLAFTTSAGTSILDTATAAIRPLPASTVAGVRDPRDTADGGREYLWTADGNGLVTTRTISDTKDELGVIRLDGGYASLASEPLDLAAGSGANRPSLTGGHAALGCDTSGSAAGGGCALLVNVTASDPPQAWARDGVKGGVPSSVAWTSDGRGVWGVLAGKGTETSQPRTLVRYTGPATDQVAATWDAGVQAENEIVGLTPGDTLAVVGSDGALVMIDTKTGTTVAARGTFAGWTAFSSTP